MEDRIMKNMMKNILMSAASIAALMLTASCSQETNEIIDEPAAPTVHSIEVTVPVTADASTRASYTAGAATTFEAGDKLYIKVQSGETYTYVGVLDNSAEAVNKFSGTLNLTAGSDYSGSDIITDCTSLEATLLPSGYDESYYVLTKSGETVTGLTVEPAKAFSAAATKAATVPQVANASYSTTGSGAKTITLTPQNAVLYYTLSGLAKSTAVTVSVSDGTTTVSGSVTTNSSGEASFAVGVAPGGTTKSYMMKKGDEQTIEFRANLSANKVYNITRSAAGSSDCLSGVFSVASGKTVKFSKGNLQATYNGSAWSWAFATNQYDCIGNAEGNTKVSNESPFVSGYSGASTTVDLFGWSTSATLYGISSLNNDGDYSGDFLDWGAAASKDLGYGWRTLTKDEWLYLFGMEASNTDKSGHARYRKYFRATVNSVKGIVVLSDDISGISNIPEETSRGTVSTFSGKTYDASAWSALEAAGCVFLPVAGFRYGTDVKNVDSYGLYWSSTTYASYARSLYFYSGSVVPIYSSNRYDGCSVRLVQDQ